MWEWDGSLPTMVGVPPCDGEAKDIRWFRRPSRNTLHFLNATHGDGKITMELPVSDEERSGALAVVKLPFRLRSGAHVNWIGVRSP